MEEEEEEEEGEPRPRATTFPAHSNFLGDGKRRTHGGQKKEHMHKDEQRYSTPPRHEKCT